MSQAAKKIAPQSTPRLLTDISWNRRVLVVDDEKEIANSYSQILGANSNAPAAPRSSRSAAPAPVATTGTKELFEVTVCYNAVEALTKVRQAIQNNKPYAMGFFDVRLGEGMDGIELVKEIHKLDPKMNAVFVTAYQDRNVDTINQFLGTDMADRWDYLNKPFSEGEILTKARNTIAIWNLRMEKEIRDLQMEELHQKVCEGDRLASVAVVSRGVAHEFGNILMQITGQAELHRDDSPDKMQKALDSILSASDVAANILTRFKAMGNPSQEKIKKEFILANDPLDSALQFMEYQLRQTNTKTCRIKNEKVQIYACSTSLIQVFINITINAIHAMGNGGQIDYSVSSIDNKWAEITIRDYGPGIPPDIIDRITEPFFTTKGSKGTGLGLAISKDIIEVEHGGELKVINNPHKGAEFVLRIPVDDEGKG